MDKKHKLIEDILKIITGENCDLIQFKDQTHVTFVKRWKNNPQIFRLMELKWEVRENKEFHFQLCEYIEKAWRPVYVGSDRWFRVRDLMKKRFLDVEKIKPKN